MKFVIGLIGEKGSGKQTFVNFIKLISPRLNIRQVRFSDILSQTLMVWDIPITRANLQKLSLVMNDAFGSQALANAARFSIEGDTSDIIIFDGIRRKTEYKLVKEMQNSLLIYITADQKLRYERLNKRSEKVGEVGLTYAQFLEEEKSKAESLISGLGSKADLKIVNNLTLSDFKKAVEAFYDNSLLSVFSAGLLLAFSRP
ncbi:AAA family ATPase [Candidatus Daviesbacteria bacterium]|nr:AAA family ATPase [Candidatus Daviesbacteria bacterium]